MKTTSRHFKQFQKYCHDWQHRFGLVTYKLYFEHVALDGKYASTGYRINERVATIRLNRHWTGLRPLNLHELKRLAKHEMLHVALAELFVLAEERYASEDAIDRAEHSVVTMLEQIIPDV